MICCFVVVVQIYYNTQEKECLSNPLVYGAKKYEEIYNVTFYGVGSFIDVKKSPIIYFNSNNVTFVNP